VNTRRSDLITAQSGKTVLGLACHMYKHFTITIGVNMGVAGFLTHPIHFQTHKEC
jgi:hypothetical protein